MMRLFTFDTLVTPSIVKFLFYIGVALSALGALSVIVSGIGMMQYQTAMGFGVVVGGLLLVGLGIIVSRVYTETILVLFMIRDELAWQRQRASSE